MNQATYFETRQFSPTSLTLIIALHAAALAAALTWKLQPIVADRGPTIITPVPIEKDPPPETKARKTEPQPSRPDVFVPPTPIPPQPADQGLTNVTQDPVPPAPLEPLPPTPVPDPPAIVQAARAKGDVRYLFSESDYPESARRNQEMGTVQARLDIGADGKVSGCSILRSSGSSALDAATCRVLKARAKFTPAKDNAGAPVGDSYVTPKIVWKIEGSG